MGIAIRGDRRVDLNAWASLVNDLQKRYHKQVLFVSNCLLTDAWVGYELQQRQGIKVLSCQYNYDEYLGIISRLDAVISDRYHTNVSAVISSVLTFLFVEILSRPTVYSSSSIIPSLFSTS